MSYLHVSNDDELDLDGSIDAAGDLDVAYDTNQLSSYDDKLFADHSDTGIETIRMKLHDFTDAQGSWEVSAIHGTQNWVSGSNCVYFDFDWLTDYVDVDVTAINTSTRAEKTKLLRIKTQPQGSLPGDTMFDEHVAGEHG